MRRIQTKKAFTLIELLVVVAIISVLTAIVLANLNTAKASSRDKKRQIDLAQLQMALEQYYDAKGIYPFSASGGVTTSCTSTSNSGSTNPTGSQKFLSALPLSPYLSTIPTDPISGVTANVYIYKRCCRMTGPANAVCNNPGDQNVAHYPEGIIPSAQDYILLTSLESVPTAQLIKFWNFTLLEYDTPNSGGYSGITQNSLNYLIGSGQN